MSTNTSIVEIVKFKSDGIDTVAAATKSLGKSIEETEKRSALLAKALESPGFTRAAARMEAAAKKSELLGLSMRNQLYAARLADGSEARRLRTASKLNQTYERMRREAAIAAQLRHPGIVSIHEVGTTKPRGGRSASSCALAWIAEG